MEKTVKLYVDSPSWDPAIKIDDFLIAVGKIKSNSVYHVYTVRAVPRLSGRIVRYHVECFKSDLMTCLKRGSDQQLCIVTWYDRNKKKKKI